MPLWVWKQRSVSICSWVRRCPEGQSHTTRWWEIQNSLSHWCVWGRRRFQEVGRELTANTRNCLKLRNQIWPKDIWSADHLENPDSDCWCTTQWNCTMSSLIMYDTEEKKNGWALHSSIVSESVYKKIKTKQNCKYCNQEYFQACHCLALVVRCK